MSSRAIRFLLLILVAGSICSSGPQFVQAQNIPTGVITAGPTTRPVIALTFDGGPSPYTARFIALLRRNYVPATFFLLGKRARQYSDLVASVHGAGNEIGNNAYSNRDLQTFSTSHVVSTLTETQSAVRQASGVTPIWFRPPFGDVDPRVTAIASTLGMRTVTWSVEAGDSANASIDSIEANVLDNVQWGSIVDMHDAGPGRLKALAALSVIIYRLKHDGYRFATLDQLFGLKPLPPCEPHETELFTEAGIKLVRGSIFHKRWLNLLCQGTNLGPATSTPHRMKHTIEAQDFARTAHQIQLNLRTGHIQVVTVLKWATAVFKAKHVKPDFRSPITASWYHHFLNDKDWGPALKKAKVEGTYIVQPFQYGWGVEAAGGAVTWHTHLRLPTP